jgi:hypothetical protein
MRIFTISILLVASATVALIADDAATWTAQVSYDGELATMRTKSKRCLASISYTLWKNYGTPISYEDPPLVYIGDLEDITKPSYHPISPPYKLYIPRGGALEFSFEISSETKKPANDENTVAALLEAYSAAQYPGKFVVRKSTSVIHIIPDQGRDKEGIVRPIAPVMSTPISLVQKANRTTAEALEIICQEIKIQTGEKIVLGTRPPADFENTVFDALVKGIAARDALDSLCLKAGSYHLWLLLYDPTFKYYVLSVF